MKTIKMTMLKAGVALALIAALAHPWALIGADETQTLQGEVVDLMCYLSNGAKGEKHAACAEKCIKSGGPVGLLTKDDHLYLIIGNHKPLNADLASHAGKTISIKGKVVERNGMKMISNAVIQE